MSVTFARTIPGLPSADIERSVAYYRDVLGFELAYSEEGMAVLQRDTATVHLWGATDESWRDRTDWERPVCSGAESFIAGTSGCRIEVRGVDDLHAAVNAEAELQDTWWGTREFHVLDPDGNLITFYEERAS